MPKRSYFVSDIHLGIDTVLPSRDREKLLIQWLDDISRDAAQIFLLGDLFDFWFEYKTVVPKGHVRLLGKLAELRDRGIDMYIFTGNHDMWMFDYFPEEFDIPICRDEMQTTILDHRFFIAHGDGKGPGDNGYKMIKKIFQSRICQWLFARLHPNFGIGLANYLSRRSRSSGEEPEFLGENEWLLQYARRKLDELPDIDYFIFGHRHLPLDMQIGSGSTRYINLGDWMYHFTYAVYDGESLRLEAYEPALALAKQRMK